MHASTTGTTPEGTHPGGTTPQGPGATSDAPHRPLGEATRRAGRLTVSTVTLAAVVGGVVTATGSAPVPAAQAAHGLPAGPSPAGGGIEAGDVLLASADRQRSAEEARADALAAARRDARAAAAQQAREVAVQRRARERAQAAQRVTRDAARNPRAAARVLLQARGWDAGQFSCLDSLWRKESNWNSRATNPSSGAYGIPQSLPGRKMAAAGRDWRTNPLTQIRWGLDYIADRHGTPCGAWAHSRARNWY